MYKKLASPDASPVLGPASPKESPVIGPTALNTSALNTSALNTSALNTSTNAVVEPFSLYNCCCSPRNHNNNTNTTQDTIQAEKQTQMPENVKPKYEFGHATHYTYRATTPRLICEFETGTPPSP
jgi:hypothetical protein